MNKTNRFITIMRKTTCIAFVFGFSSLAAIANSQNAKVKIEKNQTTIEKVIEQIEEQTDYLFVYSRNEINTDNEAQASSKETTVKECLDKALKDTDISYSLKDNYIVLKKNDTNSNNVDQQSSKKITGVVVDKNNETIIGANIVEKGTTNGTVSDFDGKFSIDVSNKGILQITYIGYNSQNIKIGSNNDLRIVLLEDTQALDEVVVTALGIKREEKALGYSVQKVSGDNLTKVKGVDIATNLTGRVSGLNVQNSTEFNEAPSLSLRGESPLLVIDGVPYANLSLRDIAADDILSVDVLKGATASALYGARGGSGAVMVTTKRGEKEGLNISINSNTMFNAGYLRLPEVQTAYSTGQGGKYLAGSYVWGDKLDIGREAKQHNPFTNEWEMQPLVSKGKNNLQNFQENSFVTNNNISVTQKGKYGSFRTSLTHVYNKGQWPNEKLNKITYTVSGKMNIGKFSAEAGATYNKRFYPNMGGKGYGGSGYLYNLLVWNGTEFDIRDYKNYWTKEDEESNWMDKSWYENPYLIANEITSSNDYNVVNAFANASYEIAPWLKATLRSGADFYSSKDEWKTPIGSTVGWGSKKGYYSAANSNGFSINNDLLLMAEKEIGDFSLSGFAGGTIYYWNTNKISSETQNGLILPGYYSLNASVDPATTSKSFTQKQVNSLYAQAALGWRSTLFLEVTGRNDWSSTLPEETRSYFYPSVSGSVIMSEFVPMPKCLNFWKVRGSWTKTKKDMSVYDINKVYSISTNVWNNQIAAYNPRSMKNGLLFPSASRSYEIGTTMHLLKNRLRVDYAYYNKLNYNNTRSATLSQTTGFTSTLINFDEEQLRKGMEVSVSGDIIESKDLNWSAMFNWSRDRYYYGNVDELYSTQKPWVAKGERWDWISAYDYQRDSLGNIIHNNEGLPLTNSFASIEGHSSPDWVWGLSTTVSWKNFSLDVAFDGRVGGVAHSVTDQAMWNSGSHIDSDNQWRYEEVVNGNKTFVGEGVKLVSGSAEWDSDGNVISDDRVFAPNDIIVSYETYQTSMNPYIGSVRTQNLLDQTFIKLRNLAINYTVPNEFCQKLNLKGVSVGFVGQNLWMWTKEFRFADPDKASDNMNTPSTRYLGFNVKLDL